MRKRILGAVLGAAILATGCSDPTPPTRPTPVPATIPETFSDTLLVAGANTHTFSVSAVGAIQVSLPSVNPGASVGLGIGFPSLGSCTPIDRVAAAVAGNAVQLSGTATVPGLFCVVIYDAGTLVEPVAYTINVLHS
jgi:hypothetical protein